MKEIGARLGAEHWALIDLTLKQFDLPVQEIWNGSSETYVLRMVEQASDSTLIELARHLGFDPEISARSTIEPTFWRKGMFRLFISHISSHKRWAADLQEAILRFGISGFVAHNDIEPTLEWQTQIETALATCDALVALLHSGFHQSNWTDQEIGFAMGRAIPVFSIRIGETPYGFIGRFQAFNGSNDEPREVAEELFKAYRNDKRTKNRMMEALITLFEESQSFAEAKARIGFLEELIECEPSFAKRIELAVDSNMQIRDAWGVPERAKSLAKKWSSK